MKDRLLRPAMTVFSLVAASALVWSCASIPPGLDDVDARENAVLVSRTPTPADGEEDDQDDDQDDESDPPETDADTPEADGYGQLSGVPRAVVAGEDDTPLTDNDGTDSDGIDTPTPTDNDEPEALVTVALQRAPSTTVPLANQTTTDTDEDGIDTPTPTDNDGTDSDGIDTPTPTDNDGTDTPTPQTQSAPDSDDSGNSS